MYSLGKAEPLDEVELVPFGPFVEGCERFYLRNILVYILGMGRWAKSKE